MSVHNGCLLVVDNIPVTSLSDKQIKRLSQHVEKMLTAMQRDQAKGRTDTASRHGNGNMAAQQQTDDIVKAVEKTVQEGISKGGDADMFRKIDPVRIFNKKSQTQITNSILLNTSNIIFRLFNVLKSVPTNSKWKNINLVLESSLKVLGTLIYILISFKMIYPFFSGRGDLLSFMI